MAIIIYIFIFGTIIGSFLNCLIWRLHKREGIIDRSYCPKCRHGIAWYDNIPILSFILLRGKCRHCGKSISWQYPAVEFITGVLFIISWNLELGFGNWDLGIVFFQIPDSKFLISIVRDWFIIAVMIVIFIYDLRYYLILDKVTLPSCIVVFILNLLIGMNWLNLLFSGIIGGSFFFLQFLVSRGKWIGGGDIRLGLLIGFSLGFPLIGLAIFLSYIIGSIIGIGLILGSKKSWGSKIPLGVFLSTGTVIALFWGEKIISWYIHLIGY